MHVGCIPGALGVNDGAQGQPTAAIVGNFFGVQVYEKSPSMRL